MERLRIPKKELVKAWRAIEKEVKAKLPIPKIEAYILPDSEYDETVSSYLGENIVDIVVEHGEIIAVTIHETEEGYKILIRESTSRNMLERELMRVYYSELQQDIILAKFEGNSERVKTLFDAYLALDQKI